MKRKRERRSLRRHFYPVVLQAPDRETRLREKKITRWPHSCGLQFMRDGVPQLELSAALTTLGLRYQGVIFNYPNSRSEGVEKISHGAVLCFATRPELEASTVKTIKVSGSRLEQHVFASLRRIFLECTRDTVQLAPIWARQLPPNWASMSFTTGSYAELKNQPRTKAETAGYLVWLPNAGPQRQSVLASFAIGATETLVWNYLIRVRHLDLVRRLMSSTTRRVILGRFTVPDSADGAFDSVPADLTFCLKCQITFRQAHDPGDDLLEGAAR